jgi:hypothetical protein
MTSFQTATDKFVTSTLTNPVSDELQVFLTGNTSRTVEHSEDCFTILPFQGLIPHHNGMAAPGEGI